MAMVAGGGWGVDTGGVAEPRASRAARAPGPRIESNDTFGAAAEGGGATATGWWIGTGVGVWAGGALIVTASAAI